MNSLTIACLTVGLAAINPTPAAPSAALLAYDISVVAGAAVSTAIAQDSLRLQFEIAIDGSVVAKPELRMEGGDEGSIAFGEKSQAVVTFTPSVRGDDIDFVFDITDGDKRFRPTLRISKTVQGSVEWISPAFDQKNCSDRGVLGSIGGPHPDVASANGHRRDGGMVPNHSSSPSPATWRRLCF